MSCFPAKQRPWLIMDRGYARVGLLMKLGLEGIPFLVRTKSNVLVYWHGKAMSLGRFSVKAGQTQRYSVRYHSKKKEPLDLIIFHGKGYKEPWYLLVPANTPESSEEIAALYAKRMSIEQGFRDWKTHLGIRGLVFVNDNPAPRLTRLLLAFSLSYSLCLALGHTADSHHVRAFVEIPRRTARHGTTRTLSALSIGILKLSLPKFASQAQVELLAIIQPFFLKPLGVAFSLVLYPSYCSFSFPHPRLPVLKKLTGFPLILPLLAFLLSPRPHPSHYLRVSPLSPYPKVKGGKPHNSIDILPKKRFRSNLTINYQVNIPT
jgi:hypothetical protein